MPEDPPDSKELGYYFALAQVGMEMVAPLGIGLGLDFYFGWLPWATVTGAVLGFVGGFIHMLALVNRHDAEERSRRNGSKP
jgi:F0F1-type ATP synthase assembly protein I